MGIDKRFSRYAILTFILFFSIAAGAAEPYKAQPLFVIERSKNANKVHYEARLTGEGFLDVRKPVHAYWINWEKDSTGKDCEELNLIEKRMAFGFSVDRARSPQSCTMKLVCCPKRPIKVFINNGTACAETDINGKPAYLHKISVVTSEKQTILPTVLSVTVIGTDTLTSQADTETIKPR
jgi:hypothetical protein